MKALRFSRNETRYVAAALASRLRPGAGAAWGPLKLVSSDPPSIPGGGWQRIYPRLSGICGSDLATIDGRSARYFEDYVSFPFIPGHEIVADTDDGRRVVIEPVLGHAARGFEPPFAEARPGDGDDYRHLVCGHLKPGLQTGFCRSTGGGWSTELIAHDSQLHDVPDWMSDELAVMIEPAAGGVHAALRARAQPGDTVAVVGAGTMGLVAVAALRALAEPGSIMVGARYSTQRRLALEFGADVAVEAGELKRAVRRATGSFMVGDHLSGGADVVIDAVGSAASLAEALSLCRPRGRVLLLGMPATVTAELTGLWHREIELVGCYAYGTETLRDGARTTSFALAMELAGKVAFDRLVSALYPLERYVEALSHAAEAGRRGGVKIAFDIR
ncbi:MAG: zinc-binding dehydrogenase [Acidimicrobiaceae bacterium]|nr:zinc-binding dehydrogenase [Acidimicrobiaceae bacterium]